MAARATFAFALAVVACTALAETTTTSNNVAESSQQPLQKQNALFDVDKYPETKQLREPSSFRNRLFAEGYTKRAAMRGFQGMRGKKSNDFLDDDYYYEKRAPMGFQGMRGKKAMDDDDVDKRAPMGFQGMRGKKNLEEMIEELEKRAMMGFQGMRGKKAEEYEEDFPELAPYYEVVDWRKRAPMGFQGMRGRRSSSDEMEKRAMQLGFHGMRGKKGGAYEQQDEMMVPLVADDGYMDKRPMMTGFHGMRGKRSANYYETDGLGRYMDKRSPYRFFGSRGKKNPRWELRGKFVGVRGKKWSQPPPRLDVLAKQLAASYDDDDDDDAWH